ncbi:radical SAM protein [Candidatus Woesearchaeota archaeon]|nr:radical SAM protein [Candidatus Woesearchaeota archaeon]
MSGKGGIAVIGVIPQYPKHSKNNIYARVRMPPVGIVSVMSQFCQDKRFDSVYAIDENNYVGPVDNMGLPDHCFLQSLKPAGVALFYGGMSNSIPRLFSVAKQYKRFGAVTIAGGSHVDALPAEALRSGVDIVVHGEGEVTMKEILDIIIKDGVVCFDPDELRGVKGISLLGRDGSFIFTGKREPIARLDDLQDVDLTLIKHLARRWSAIPVNRGRGCNYNCEFCVVNKQYGRFKSLSVERAMRQVIKYSDLGYKSFFFTDDNFAQDVEEAILLSRMIGDYKRRFNKKIGLMVQVRTEVAENDRLIAAMKYAGVHTLAIGYESPINEELKAMRKGVTVEKLVSRSRKLADSFYLHGMFIFGYPSFHDSKFKSSLPLEKRARMYKRFFKKARIDTVQMLNAVPLPGSLLRTRLEAEGRVLPLETVGWDKYDGLWLCYDARPEGLDQNSLEEFPKVLMKSRYQGNFISRNVNYGNWMNWAYYATIGFPVQFGVFYMRRFFHNLAEQRSIRRLMSENERALGIKVKKRNIFHEPLVRSWGDIRRKWRNLAVKTYAGGIVRDWYREYRKSPHPEKVAVYFSKSRKTSAS